MAANRIGFGVISLGLMWGCTCGPPAPPPPATGFSQVHLSTHAEDGLQVSLALDGDDQPMIAFLKVDLVDSANNAVYFTRYDSSASAWTTPVVVAAGVGPYGTGTLTQQLWLARDASTGRLGLAFLKTEQFCAGVNLETTVHLSFSTDQGATWSASERVSEAQYTRNDPINGVAVCDTNSPRLALANGQVHLAYGASAGELQASGLSFWVGYYYASSTAPGVWTRTLLPHDGDDARKGNGVLSLALDATGAPALAYVMRSVNPTGYQNAFLYVRPGAAPVRITDSNNLQNDNPQLSLAFDGVKPRVAGMLTRSADTQATWLFRSEDGAAFSEVRVPDDGRDQGGDYMDLSWRGGKGVLAYRYGTSSMKGQCGGPKLSRSTDAVTWTTCGADEQSHQFLGNFVSAELAATGKLVMAFHAPSVDEAAPARWERGIVLWREP